MPNSSTASGEGKTTPSLFYPPPPPVPPRPPSLSLASLPSTIRSPVVPSWPSTPRFAGSACPGLDKACRCGYASMTSFRRSLFFDSRFLVFNLKAFSNIEHSKNIDHIDSRFDKCMSIMLLFDRSCPTQIVKGFKVVTCSVENAACGIMILCKL